MTSNYAGEQTEQSFQLDQDLKNTITDTKGVNVAIALAKEEADSAELLVEIKLADQEPMQSLVKVQYGEKQEIKCPAEGVDAALTLLATPIAQ